MSPCDCIPQIGKPYGACMTGVAGIAGLLALLVSAGCGAGSTNTSGGGGGGGGGGPVAAKVSGTIALGNTP